MEWLLILVLEGSQKGGLETVRLKTQVECMTVRMETESMSRRITGKCIKVQKLTK